MSITKEMSSMSDVEINNSRLFEAALPYCAWQAFKAEGFSDPVTGVIYGPESPPTHGMPLGGIDTGCLDLSPTGMLGFLTIFNSLTPRRGPINQPLFGVRVNDEVHALAAHGMPGIKAPRSID